MYLETVIEDVKVIRESVNEPTSQVDQDGSTIIITIIITTVITATGQMGSFSRIGRRLIFSIERS